MWVDPMLLAINWGAALLMALGLGIVYWHATRDTGPLSSLTQRKEKKKKRLRLSASI